MRIRDWSSDVCSSDLGRVTFPGRTAAVLTGRPGSAGRGMWNCGVTHRVPLLRFAVTGGARVARGGGVSVATRSEEHTSELQSLMRISSAVFCLKQQTTPPANHLPHQ